MTRIHTIVIIASVALVTFDAQAADQPAPLPVKAQASAPAYRWTGLYFGGHFGYGGGGFGPGTNPAHNEAVVFPSSVTGLIGGYQVGYNWQLPNNVVLGVEGDITFLSPLDVNATATAPFNTTLNYVATARGRAGYAFGNFVPYVTGGLAVGQSKVEALDGDGAVLSPKQHTHVGWTAGVGVGAHGDDLALRRLFLNGVRNDDTAGGLLLGVDALDDHTVVQGTELELGHAFLVGARAR